MKIDKFEFSQIESVEFVEYYFYSFSFQKY